jgi:hypothetical protein
MPIIPGLCKLLFAATAMDNGRSSLANGLAAGVGQRVLRTRPHRGDEEDNKCGHSQTVRITRLPRRAPQPTSAPRGVRLFHSLRQWAAAVGGGRIGDIPGHSGEQVVIIPVAFAFRRLLDLEQIEV